MVKFGERVVGDGAPCFITYEAGPTHDGLETAKKLVTLAAQAGADAVKFQIADPDRLVADRKQPFSYDILLDRATGKTQTVSEPLYDLVKRRALTRDEWRALKKHSDSLKLAFFATIAFEDEIDFVAEMGCDSIKIGSADVNYLPLIRRAAKTGLCLQLDTGNATIGEIEVAVDAIRAQGNENIIIHQCPSGYPARLESINLRIIPTLKRMFNFPVAYSDHTPGWDMDVAAVAMGANLVEKTITLDRMTRSVEHVFSLEGDDLKKFVQIIRDVETAMGSPRRMMHPQEMEKRLATRRSVFLKAPAKAGDKFKAAQIEFRRPGYGIGPDQYEALPDLAFRTDLPAGHRVALSDLV